MAFNKYENMILLLLLSVMLFSSSNNRSDGKLSSPESHDQHKPVNAHVIKTFQEDNGDIVDCIDIYKQPALSHPLLKTHQIQLKVQRMSETVFAENSNNMSLDIFHTMTKCPEGYVPIKRTANENLMTAKYLNYSINSKLTGSEITYNYDAFVEYRGKLHGAKGHINVWGLSNVSTNQLSSASIYIQDGPMEDVNTIMAGWMVNPHLFGDTRTRLFVFWSVNGHKDSNCYNHICPGFVQDLTTGNWWLISRNEHIGYWPKSLFTVLQDGGHYASWGGHVITPKDEPTPPMGSGVLPMYRNRRKVAYIRQIQVNNNGNYNDPDNIKIVLSVLYCYDAQYRWEDGAYWGHHIIFGGPSGCPVPPSA